MSERNRKIAIILSIMLLIIGLAGISFGMTYEPNKTLDYVDKYDQAHAEEQLGTISKVLNPSQNTSVENIYIVKNKEDLSNETYNASTELIENTEKDSAVLYESDTVLTDKYALEYQGEYYIFSMSYNIPSPSIIIFVSLILWFIGIYYLYKLTGNKKNELPDGVRKSNVDDWEFQIDE